MEVKQIAQFVNDATLEALGRTAEGNPVALIKEDLSNVVDVGTAIFNAQKYSAYLEALINRIGRTIFVDRVYQGKAPKVLRDGWEYGSIMQKISTDLPEAEETESWSLVNGASYDPNVFTKDKVTAKFYNQKTTLTIKKSITKLQLKQSFDSAGQLNSFLSMIYVWVENSMTVKMDELIMRTINNMIASTIYADYQGASTSSASHARAVNLLYAFKQLHPSSTLTASDCLYDVDFLRFATGEIGKYVDRLQSMSRIFNIENQARFTPRDKLHVVLHTDFLKNADTYLNAVTFHEEFNKLPYGESVPYWQGTGGDYAFADTSRINVKDADGHEIEQGGILAVMFDHDALGVLNEDARTTNDWNAVAEFWNEWHKKDASFFNDGGENFVLFFVA